MSNTDGLGKSFVKQACGLDLKSRLNFHIKCVSNGFIISDFTDKSKVSTYVACNKKSLKEQIIRLIDLTFTETER